MARGIRNGKNIREFEEGILASIDQQNTQLDSNRGFPCSSLRRTPRGGLYVSKQPGDELLKSGGLVLTQRGALQINAERRRIADNSIELTVGDKIAIALINESGHGTIEPKDIFNRMTDGEPKIFIRRA